MIGSQRASSVTEFWLALGPVFLLPKYATELYYYFILPTHQKAVGVSPRLGSP